MRNVAITLKYLGTAYHGWQVQKTQVTVGETVEKAVAMVVGHPVHVTGCGRTDAGADGEPVTLTDPLPSEEHDLREGDASPQTR